MLLAHGAREVPCVHLIFVRVTEFDDVTEYSMTARFDQGDPAYEWILHFLVRVPPPHSHSHRNNHADPRKSLDSVERLSRQREKLQTRMERRKRT